VVTAAEIMAVQNAAHTTAAKMKRGANNALQYDRQKNNYVVRLLGSQSTIFRAHPRNKKAAGLTPGGTAYVADERPASPQ
jgi:hypothetical protein